MRGIGKSFPGVRALDGVSLTLDRGEVLAIVGENGAGKSTLMKILSGAVPADEGEILIDGAPVSIPSPRSAEQLGIGMIYQEFTLVGQLTAPQNIALGNEPMRGPFVDDAAVLERARKTLDELGLQLPLAIPTARLSVGQQQLVEIAKALARHARIVVMDEPTAALTEREIERLFGIIARLKVSGVGILYISHRLEELPHIADRITVLRDGKVVETRSTAAYSNDEIIAAMVGRRLEAQFPVLPAIAQDAPIVLEVRDLRRRPVVRGVGFSVHAGEIVGLAGLVGAGRTEILRAIAGADVPDGGEIRVEGKRLQILTPHDGIASGIAFITEDRKAQGLVLGMTVRENISLAHLGEFVDRDLLVDRRREAAAARSLAEQLHVRTPTIEQIVRNLSGGNQQKVVLAKWLLGKARVFLFDEPTRGIDVGSKAEIYGLMLRLAAGGAAIVMVSSELPEVLAMSHRIFVIREGAIAAEFAHDEAAPDKVIAAAAGVAA